MRLPHVGWSKVHKKWVDIPRNVNTTLQGKSVHLLPQSLGEESEKAYQGFWSLILRKLGANIVTGK